MKKMIFLSLCLLGVTFLLIQATSHQTGTQKQRINPRLADILAKKFPGYRIVTTKDFCSFILDATALQEGKRWSYDILTGQFNSDDQEDYTLILRADGHYHWIAALTTTNPEKPYAIHDFGEPEVATEEEPNPQVQKGNICMILTEGSDKSIYLMGDGQFIQAYVKGTSWIAEGFVD